MSKYIENVGEYVARDYTATFTDEDGAAALPTTVMWRHTCPDNNDSVVSDWATATAVTSTGPDGYSDVVTAAIAVVASDHAMVTTTLAKEKHALIVAADKGLDTEWNEEFLYYVERRSGRS